MVLQLPSGPRASHDCTSLPCGSHSEMRPRLDVHTWPCESAKMPITCPHVKSAGSTGHFGSAVNCGTPLSGAAGCCAVNERGGQQQPSATIVSFMMCLETVVCAFMCSVA